jgi:DNA-binding MarR family transcriptional regulator
MDKEINVNNGISKISQLHTLIQDFLLQKLGEKGFTEFASSHGNILFQLNKTPQIKMGELSAKINRDKSTTTVLVRKLIALGLVQEEVDPKDKRNKFISLTKKGKEYNQMTDELSNELQKTFYKGFTSEEKEQFCAFLNRIEENFIKQ